MENARVDFDAVKQIPIEKIAERYKIQLTGRGKWRYAVCPLPSHDPAKKKDKFGINTEKNYWSCFSKSCQDRRDGAEWGDVITLVQYLEGCGAGEAAEKLTEWFLAPQEEKIQPPQVTPNTPTAVDSASDRVSGANGYMAETDTWFAKLIVRNLKESEVEFWGRIRKAVKARLYSSYQSGLTKAQSKAA